LAPDSVQVQVSVERIRWADAFQVSAQNAIRLAQVAGDAVRTGRAVRIASL
jgi:hypothetical protein